MSSTFEQPDPHPVKAKIDTHTALIARQMPGTLSGSVFHSEVSDASRLWSKLRKQWKLSALFAATVFTVVVGITLTTRPTYEPVAQLEVDPQGAELFSPSSSSEPGIDQYLGTATRKLQSDELAITVIRQLHLDQAPEFTDPPNSVERFIATVRSFATPAPGTSASSTNASVRLTRAESLALERFHKQVKVQRDATSRIISVSYSSTDPVVAANVTNTLLATFIQMTYAQRDAAIAPR